MFCFDASPRFFILCADKNIQSLLLKKQEPYVKIRPCFALRLRPFFLVACCDLCPSSFLTIKTHITGIERLSHVRLLCVLVAHVLVKQGHHSSSAQRGLKHVEVNERMSNTMEKVTNACVSFLIARKAQTHWSWQSLDGWME